MVTLSSRRERVEQLAGYLDGTLPDDAVRSDVRRLATLAGTVTAEIEPPRLSEAERDRIRTRIMAAVHTDLQAADAVRTGTARAPRSARAAVATGVASVLIGTGGVAVAAQEALPGDALYGIKQATESVRVAAAGDATEQGRLELALAAERLDEVTAAVDRGGARDDALIDTLQRMDARSAAGAETLVRIADTSGDRELLDEVEDFIARQAGGLFEVFDRLPVQVRPHAEDSLATLRAIRDELVGPALGTDRDVASAELAAAIDALLRSAPLPPAPALESPSGGGTDEPSNAGSRAPTSTSGSTDQAPAAPVTPEDSDVPALPVPAPDRTTTSGGDGGDRTLVPRLPGPLDDVGRTVDDTVGGVLDSTGKLLDDTTGAVGDVVEGVGDAVGGVLDSTLGGVGRLLGGSSSSSD